VIEANSQFTDVKFKAEHIENSRLVSKTFMNCTFEECSFKETEFISCRFVDCYFHNCDLSLIKVKDNRFSDVHFNSSKVIGVNWAQVNWSAGLLDGSLNFLNCALNHSTFLGVPLPGVKIIDCAASDVDFRECNLTKADFTGTDLSGSLFYGTNLTEANLRDAYNYQIDPRKNNVARTRFSLPEAMSLLFNMDIILDDE
jgi:fluoroquinolone resistance protein